MKAFAGRKVVEDVERFYEEKEKEKGENIKGKGVTVEKGMEEGVGVGASTVLVEK
jgi:hypothetical protein